MVSAVAREISRCVATWEVAHDNEPEFTKPSAEDSSIENESI